MYLSMLSEEVIFIPNLKTASPNTTDFSKVTAGSSYVPKLHEKRALNVCNKKQTVLNSLVVHQCLDIVQNVPQMIEAE